MAETKWTPGPWDGRDRGRKDSNFGGYACRVIAPDSLRKIAKVYGDDVHNPAAQAQANALLIAAAPDLYAALEACEREMQWAGAHLDCMPDEYADAMHRARAALLRARGEKP